jgi:hypothetical protein
MNLRQFLAHNPESVAMGALLPIFVFLAPGRMGFSPPGPASASLWLFGF